MTTKVTPLPETFDFDLDSYERPAEEVIPDLRLKLGGRILTFTNPDEIDWKDLLDITDPVTFLRHSCSREDFDFILNLELPGHKFNKMMEHYYKHFRVQERMDEAQRAERLRTVGR